MSETDTWSAEVKNAYAKLQSLFPDLCCLRCGKDKFLMRLRNDEHLSLSFSTPRGYNVVELICENCGHLEKHFIPLLERAQVE